MFTGNSPRKLPTDTPGDSTRPFPKCSPRLSLGFWMHCLSTVRMSPSFLACKPLQGLVGCHPDQAASQALPERGLTLSQTLVFHATKGCPNCLFLISSAGTKLHAGGAPIFLYSAWHRAALRKYLLMGKGKKQITGKDWGDPQDPWERHNFIQNRVGLSFQAYFLFNSFGNGWLAEGWDRRF